MSQTELLMLTALIIERVIDTGTGVGWEEEGGEIKHDKAAYHAGFAPVTAR